MWHTAYCIYTLPRSLNLQRHSWQPNELVTTTIRLCLDRSTAQPVMMAVATVAVDVFITLVRPLFSK